MKNKKNNSFKWSWAIFCTILTNLFKTLASMSFSLIIINSNDILGNLPLWGKILLIFVLFAFFILFYYLAERGKNSLFKSLILEYKEKIYKDISLNAYEKIKSSESGEIQSAFLKDAEIIRSQRYNSVFSIISGFSILIFSFVGILVFSYWLLLVTVTLSIVMFLLSTFLQGKMGRYQNENSRITANYSVGLIGLLKGISTFFTYNKLQNFENKIDYVNNKFESENLKNQNKILNIQMCLIGLSASSQVIVLAVAAILVSLGWVTAGVLLAIGDLCASFINGSSNIISEFITFRSTKDIWKKYDVKETPKQVTNLFPTIKEINFKNIEISYDNKKILNHFNQKFNANTNYLIKGPSGSGKSTLVKTLVGLNEINKGKLTVNGIIINQDNIHELREKIAYIDQNIYLFPDSLAYNIALDNNYNEAEIQEILKTVNLEKFFKKALTENIGGDLEKISGGEKRRIGLARALYAKKEIFIVDESTSNLDPINKDAIEKLILQQKDKMIFLISHDLTKENESLINQVVEINPQVSL